MSLFRRHNYESFNASQPEVTIENPNLLSREPMQASNSHEVKWFVLRNPSEEKTQELSDFTNILCRQNFTTNPDLSEIEYYIPGCSKEGVVLNNELTSYSIGQNEYLLDKASLCRIMDVRVEDGKAHLKMSFIPKEIWKNENY